jgi:hypothetical protein
VVERTRLARKGAAIAAALTAAALSFGTAAAQEPDSLAAAPPDSLAVAAPDSLSQAADSAAVDTLPPLAFPIFPDPADREVGLAWQWGLRDLLSTGALTLGKILEFTPFFNPVRAGFLEGPEVAVFAGRGPASLRVNEDGYEIVPILGGALDLRTEPLAQIEGMSLVFEPGGYRLYAKSYRNTQSAPYSRIEAGTGDRQTNLLRGFLSSRIGKSLVGFGFDRIDTTGQSELGDSQRTIVWLSLARQLPLGLWGQIEYRNSTSDRTSFPSPSRRDWVFRLRRPFGDGWHADLIAGSGRLKIDATETNPAVERSVRQIGVRGARTTENWRAFLALRYWDGENVPPFESEGSFEMEAGRASFFASGRYAYWEDFHSAAVYTSFSFRLPLGLRALAEAEEGDRGIFGRLPRWDPQALAERIRRPRSAPRYSEDPPAQRFNFTRWTAGGELKLWSWKLGAKAGRWRSAPSLAVGAPIDTIVSLPGGTVSVFEAWASGRLLSVFGGNLMGGGRYTSRGEGDFLYWPKDGWRLDGVYQVSGLEDQLDVRLTGMIGIRGPMWVTDAADIVLTSDLLWWRVEAVVRVKDFFLFYNYEFYDSAGVLGDLPGYPLLPSRYHFGVKWEFWN